jgi:hypothetical protein
LAKAKLSQVLVYEKPASVRLDIFATSLNRLVALLIAKDGTLNALDLTHGVSYSGDDDGQALRHLLGIPLRSPQLARWLAACAHMPRTAEMAFGVSDDSFLIAYNSGDKPPLMVVQKISKIDWLEGNSYCPRLLALEVIKGDEIIFSSEILDENSDGQREIKFTFPVEGVSGEVKSVDLEFNVELLRSSRLFMTRVPPSFEQRPLSNSDSYGVLFDY